MQRTPRNAQTLIPWAGLFLAVAGIIYQAGALSEALTRTTERVTKLEANDEARNANINAINVRTARIEAKIDYVLPDRREGPK